jgi:hypothetical protein
MIGLIPFSGAIDGTSYTLWERFSKRCNFFQFCTHSQTPTPCVARQGALKKAHQPAVVHISRFRSLLRRPSISINCLPSFYLIHYCCVRVRQVGRTGDSSVVILVPYSPLTIVSSDLRHGQNVVWHFPSSCFPCRTLVQIREHGTSVDARRIHVTIDRNGNIHGDRLCFITILLTQGKENP